MGFQQASYCHGDIPKVIPPVGMARSKLPFNALHPTFTNHMRGVVILPVNELDRTIRAVIGGHHYPLIFPTVGCILSEAPPIRWSNNGGYFMLLKC